VGESHGIETVTLSGNLKKLIPLGPCPAFDASMCLRGGENLHGARNLPMAAQRFNQLLLLFGFLTQPVVDM
jgi:hypothetical protein